MTPEDFRITKNGRGQYRIEKQFHPYGASYWDAVGSIHNTGNRFDSLEEAQKWKQFLINENCWEVVEGA